MSKKKMCQIKTLSIKVKYQELILDVAALTIYFLHGQHQLLK